MEKVCVSLALRTLLPHPHRRFPTFVEIAQAAASTMWTRPSNPASLSPRECPNPPRHHPCPPIWQPQSGTRRAFTGNSPPRPLPSPAMLLPTTPSSILLRSPRHLPRTTGIRVRIQNSRGTHSRPSSIRLSCLMPHRHTALTWSIPIVQMARWPSRPLHTPPFPRHSQSPRPPQTRLTQAMSMAETTMDRGIRTERMTLIYVDSPFACRLLSFSCTSLLSCM